MSGISSGHRNDIASTSAGFRSTRNSNAQMHILSNNMYGANLLDTDRRRI